MVRKLSLLLCLAAILAFAPFSFAGTKEAEGFLAKAKEYKVIRDWDKFEGNLERAADADPASARIQYEVGLEYYNGRGLLKDTSVNRTTEHWDNVILVPGGKEKYGDKMSKAILDRSMAEFLRGDYPIIIGMFDNAKKKEDPNPDIIHLTGKAADYAVKRDAVRQVVMEQLKKSLAEIPAKRDVVYGLGESAARHFGDSAIPGLFEVAGDSEKRVIDERIYLHKLAIRYSAGQAKASLWPKYRDLALAEKDESKAKEYRDFARTLVKAEIFNESFKENSVIVLAYQNANYDVFKIPDIEIGQKSPWIHVDTNSYGYYRGSDRVSWNVDVGGDPSDDELTMQFLDSYYSDISKIDFNNYKTMKFKEYKKSYYSNGYGRWNEAIRLVAVDKPLRNIWLQVVPHQP